MEEDEGKSSEPQNAFEYNYKVCNVDNVELKRLYRNRYKLFWKYDKGTVMDKESWYSVTPENLARVQAARIYELFFPNSKGKFKPMKPLTIVDLMCGSGGNTIQFAKRFSNVISMDIDYIKIHCAKHNSRIYRVYDNIDFVLCNSLDMFEDHKLLLYGKVDVLFVSPPWGGLGCTQEPVFDDEKLFNGLGLYNFLLHSKKISPNLALFLPRNIDTEKIKKYSKELDLKPLVIDKHYINNRFKFLTVYLGKFGHK